MMLKSTIVVKGCVLDGDLGPLSVVWLQLHEDLQDGLGPVGAVGQQTQVREGLLRRARLPLHLGQLVTWPPREGYGGKCHTLLTWNMPAHGTCVRRLP